MAPKRVCVFCASNTGTRPAFQAAAAQLGQALARAGATLVYGGGKVGLMGAVADAALAADGEVVGVIPDALMAKELGHAGVTRLEVVASMHERKARMADLADGFVALPGGLGTFEELCEILTWAQLGFHAKPVVVLDVEGFYEPFFALLDAACAGGFLRPEHAGLAVRATDVPEALRLLARTPPSVGHKWIDRDQT